MKLWLEGKLRCLKKVRSSPNNLFQFSTLRSLQISMTTLLLYYETAPDCFTRHWTLIFCEKRHIFKELENSMYDWSKYQLDGFCSGMTSGSWFLLQTIWSASKLLSGFNSIICSICVWFCASNHCGGQSKQQCIFLDEKLLCMSFSLPNNVM